MIHPRESRPRLWPVRAALVRAACAVLCAACGFGGEPPFPGVRPAAVAPWDDLGPITICEGAQLLGPPDLPSAGFCTDAAPSLRACAADTDCGTRERCTCAGCQVALCRGGDDCAAGQTCNFAEHRCDRPCRGDADCPDAETCPPGVLYCRGRCASAADCQGGEVCERGLCAVSHGDWRDSARRSPRKTRHSRKSCSNGCTTTRPL